MAAIIVSSFYSYMWANTYYPILQSLEAILLISNMNCSSSWGGKYAKKGSVTWVSGISKACEGFLYHISKNE
ncbi:hypothetical protein XELAEV_18005282mg [Xenopus laevis]|uniref:Uncharacterized protein n=1 Tax=Xenopus laevis TaxID=8355 RepID=A0A974I2Z1_XENLA|nr:hypothetical protein XELAEV_18005282mg [Xenopus laevis]